MADESRKTRNTDIAMDRATRIGHVDAAIDLIRGEGAVTFMDLADFLGERGVCVHGSQAMELGRHAVGNGNVITRPSSSRNILLWNGADAEFLRIVEEVLARESRVVLERTSSMHYRRGGMVLLEDYIGDDDAEKRLPAINFGEEFAADGYAIPTWLPVMLAWSGVD